MREEKCAATESVVRPPPPLPHRFLPPSYDFLLAPLSSSLFPSFCSPSKSAPLAPLQPSSARSRVRESCISIFFRWSKQGPYGSRSRMLATLPLSRPFLTLFLFLPPPPLLLFRREARGPCRATNPLLKTHTRAVPDSFRTMARVFSLSFYASLLSLALSSFSFTTLVLFPAYPSSLCRAKPSTLIPPPPCTSDVSSLLHPLPCDAILRPSEMSPMETCNIQNLNSNPCNLTLIYLACFYYFDK